MVQLSKPHFAEALVDKVGLITAGWGRSFEELFARVGAGKLYNLGGLLTSNVTAVGNVGTGEDNLITYSLQKNTMLTIGDRLEIVAFGTLAANGNNKTIKLYLGSTQLFSTGAVASNAKDWVLIANIIRTGSATQECITSFNGDTVLVTQTSDYVSGTEDFTTALTIKCTGEATSNDDVIQKGLTINLYPAG